jgi:hypothetical protein
VLKMPQFVLIQNYQFGSGNQSRGGESPGRRYELIDNMPYQNTHSFQVAVHNSFRVNISDALSHLSRASNKIITHSDKHWSLTSLCISDKTGGSFFFLMFHSPCMAPQETAVIFLYICPIAGGSKGVRAVAMSGARLACRVCRSHLKNPRSPSPFGAERIRGENTMLTSLCTFSSTLSATTIPPYVPLTTPPAQIKRRSASVSTSVMYRERGSMTFAPKINLNISCLAFLLAFGMLTVRGQDKTKDSLVYNEAVRNQLVVISDGAIIFRKITPQF